MGFSGVVMIMQPGANIFSLFSIFPILAALCYATSSTIVKIFPADRLSGVIQFRSQIFAALFSLLLWLGFGDFAPISSVRDLGLFVGLGLLGGVGVLGLVVAYRMSQPSLLAPFEYFGIPFSLFLGWYVFAEAPFDRLFPWRFSNCCRWYGDYLAAGEGKTRRGAIVWLFCTFYSCMHHWS